MEFVAYLRGEILFDGFTVSILRQRGSAVPKALVTGKHITVMSKDVDKRERDALGNPTITYSCGVLNSTPLALGDTVTLDYERLDIAVTLRVVSLSVNPYDKRVLSLEVGNYANALEDDLYRIETSTVVKDKLYNGTRIGPEFGFEAVRSDKKARAYFNSTNLAMQAGDGSGNWTNKLYYDYDSETGAATLVFDGKLSATLIEALRGQFDIVVSNTVITNVLSAQKGYIAELTVDELDTSTKVQRYLDQSTEPANYIRISGNKMEFITATTDGGATEQVEGRFGSLYWCDETHKETTTETTEYPVLIYIYEEAVKLSISFVGDGSDATPEIQLGQGSGVGDNEKAYIRKVEGGIALQYYADAAHGGELRQIELTDEGVFITPWDLEDIQFYLDGFSTTYSGQIFRWLWEKDGDGRITKLTNDKGDVIVGWNEGAMPV